MEKTETGGIRVLERAMDVLTFMAEKNSPLRVSDIAEGTCLSPATAYRILSTMRERKVIVQGTNSLYMMGPAPLFWAGAYHLRFALEQAFREKCTELWKMSRETVHLFSFEGDRIYYIDKLESPQAVVMRSRVGAWRDLYSTGGGRAVLAALPQQELTAYIQRTKFTKRTNDTIIDPQELLRRLDRGRQLGYQEEVNENEEGIRCVAAPLLNTAGYPVGAISVSAPCYRTDDERAAKLGRATQLTAEEINALLKHQ